MDATENERNQRAQEKESRTIHLSHRAGNILHLFLAHPIIFKLLAINFLLSPCRLNLHARLLPQAKRTHTYEES